MEMADERFGDRLRAAMLAAGYSRPTQLAKACGVSRQTAAKWLDLAEANVSALYLFKIATCLHVRMTWLITGQGVARWGLHAREEDLEKALEILEHLPADKLKDWLDCGEKMAAA